MPAGVKYTVTGNTALVEGPKGKVTRAHSPQGSRSPPGMAT